MINFAFKTMNALKQIAKLIIDIIDHLQQFLFVQKTWGK